MKKTLLSLITTVLFSITSTSQTLSLVADVNAGMDASYQDI